MIEIKSGVELDRAVAGVIGLVCTQRVLGSDVEYYVDPRDGTSAIPERFRPSTDLNAAFAAAEAVGLFTVIKHGYSLAMDAADSEWWDVFDADDRYASWLPNLSEREKEEAEARNVLASGDTPALAICAAILELHRLDDGVVP